jgi:hypothetical protein
VLTALPDPVPGTVRRTLSLEVTPDPEWSEGLRITATGRDALIGAVAPAPVGSAPVSATSAAFTASADDNSKLPRAVTMSVAIDAKSRITAIEADLPVALTRSLTASLIGAGAVGGFRARLAALGEADGQDGPDPSSLDPLLDLMSLESAVLDELPTVRLISGYARMMEVPPSATFPPGSRSPMVGVCAGWAPGATADTKVLAGTSLLTGTPPAAAIEALTPYFHAERAIRPRSMRRRRVLDVTLREGRYEIFEYFRDSHVDRELREGALHEYIVRASAAASVAAPVVATGATPDVADDDLTLERIEVEPLSLPFAECPLAAPNAVDLEGVPLRGISGTVKGRLTGTRSCTHLNDTLRFLRYAPALAASIPREAGTAFPRPGTGFPHSGEEDS